MTSLTTDMLITTTHTIAGHETVETLGLVRGATARANHIGSDIVVGQRGLVGGEGRGYSSLLAGAREQAPDRICADTRQQGTDAVVDFWIETSSLANDTSKIVAYGTAVRLR